MDHGAYGDVAQRQVVARLDVGPGAGLDGVTLRQLVRRDDVALLAVREVQQRDAGGAVRVVLDVRDLGRHAVLVSPTEVDDTVGALVATTLMARRDATQIVATGLAVFAFDQRRMRTPLVKLGIDDLDHRAAAGGGRFDFNQCHYLASPATKLIS